jgi:chalcone isomerase-like protein
MKRTATVGGVLVLALFGTTIETATGTAQARECKGITFPEHLQVGGSDLTLNGLGMRKATFLKVNVYVGALYVAHPSHDPQPLLDPAGPAELILHFVRSVGVGDLRDAWKEGFEKVAKDQLPALQARIATLNSWMSGMETGQRLTFTRLPGAGIQVDVNGVVKGTIPGDDFARALMTIWLGPNPPNSELKSGLLGGSCD